MDIVENPIKFKEKKFDIVLAQGLFEYLGEVQSRKFADIRDLLKDDGKFIVSYVNFGHRRRQVYWPYSNIQPLDEFQKSLGAYFHIDRLFPTSHNWNHSEPNRRLLRAVQRHVNINVPAISPALAVEYFFICSAPRSKAGAGLAGGGAGASASA